MALSSLLQGYLQSTSIATSPQTLYEPVNYMMLLGGKRIRPLVCLAACELFGKAADIALPAAAAIEWFHNFTLVHDDVMDKAETRRGRATVHHRYGINTAILGGDVMLVKAYQYLEGYAPQKLSLLLGVFNRTAIQVCEGQQYDMDFETLDSVSMSNYVQMINLKTAVLLAAALQMGAIIADAHPADAQHLYEFGRNIGIAFQLQDDILDTFGTAIQTGKHVGGDILNNKKTCLLIAALEKADADTARQLRAWLSTQQPDDAEAKIAAVTQIFGQLGVQNDAQLLMQSYYRQALDHLRAVAVDDVHKSLLYQIAADLMHRRV